MSRETHRNRQLVRVLRLVAILREQWTDLDTLAVALDCTTRTIRRDLAAIQEIYAPVTEADGDMGRRKKYRLIGVIPNALSTEVSR